ncbi:MAG: rod shape-determining protein MreC [Thermodesulfobacteriota bacterium]
MRSQRNIYSFFKRNQIIVVSLLLALFSLHLALTDKKEVARGYIVKEVLSVTLTPLQRLMLAAHGRVSGVWTNYMDLVGVKEENVELRRTVASLEGEVQRLKEDVGLNARLLGLLGYKKGLPFKAVASGILGYNMESWTRTIIIDKGAAEGMKRDYPVITPTGVVGRIIETNRHTSKVLLNTDLRSNIGVMMQRTRVKGVVEGNGTDGLILKYIRQIDDIRLGDRIITAGLGGVFPKGLVIGEVTRIEKSKDNFFKFIEARPAIDIHTIEEVLVVTETGFKD